MRPSPWQTVFVMVMGMNLGLSSFVSQQQESAGKPCGAESLAYRLTRLPAPLRGLAGRSLIVNDLGREA